MPYVNVTLDLGAALNAYKLIWNYPDTFQNVIIHLGDFHFLKEAFNVLGQLVQCSGFEDIIFQAGISSSGSLHGVINGTHYNRCWKIHQHFAEALERLLFKRFVSEMEIDVQEIFTENDIKQAAKGLLNNVTSNASIKDLQVKYNNYKEMIRKGNLGRTSQFWVVNYLDIMEVIQLVHTAVQEGNFDLRIEGWKRMMPYFFSLNKTNYSRYGSYYIGKLRALESTDPGSLELIRENGISVQAQDRYPLRTAIDQRGEQTLNREAKTTGGIISFAGNDNSVTKWTLNRASQAKITAELKMLSQVGNTDERYKALRPFQVQRSEKWTNDLVQKISKDFLDPFEESLDPTKLYNLSSGIPVDDENVNEMLKIHENGEVKYAEFTGNRLFSKETDFHSTLKRNPVKLFKSCSKKVSIEKSSKVKSIEVNRNIIGTLLALSAKTNKLLDFEAALSFPLCSVPLSLANADGSRRTTQKSKLAEIIRAKTTFLQLCEIPAKRDVVCYILDLMALIRVQKSIPVTYEELVLQIIRAIPQGYKRIDIVADTYRDESIKNPERKKRGCSQQILIKSAKAKIPQNFNDFLKNSNNKTRLIELTLKVIEDKKNEIFSILKTDEIYFSGDNLCTLITCDGSFVIEELSSSQEEADTKVCLHALHAVRCNADGFVIVRNHSGDIDINVLLISRLLEFSSRVIVDSNKGKHREVFRLSDVGLTRDEKAALIGLHAFTGNDYTSAFFGKGKYMCWKTATKWPQLLHTFARLGDEWIPSNELLDSLEKFVCCLYGKSRAENVNDVRHRIFSTTYQQKNKIIDLSLLPPCKQALRLHSLRCNYVAKIWKSLHISNLELPSISRHGWNEECEIQWIENAFPGDIEDILAVSEDEEDDEEYNGDSESSDDSDLDA